MNTFYALLNFSNITIIKILFFIKIKLKIFFAEHLHADDEIRLILDGSGFFDIRDDKDEWVRIMVSKGDLITLPAGSYHRFTTDDKVNLNFSLLINE